MALHPRTPGMADMVIQSPTNAAVVIENRAGRELSEARAPGVEHLT